MGRKQHDGIRDTTSSAAQVDADECACEAEIIVPLDTPTLLMQEIAERVAVATMIRDTPGNSQAVLLVQTHCTQGLSLHHDVITGLQHTHIRRHGSHQFLVLMPPASFCCST